MAGEVDLDRLLRGMKPTLNPGEYVFCITKDLTNLDINDILLIFKEQEGITIVLEKQVADKLGLNYPFVASWITLTIHSSLEAIGFTSAFSRALSNENISCNVVAGYFHDHLFVPQKDAEKAMILLQKLSQQSDTIL